MISCRSSKELIFLSNMADEQKAGRLAEIITQHLIKPGDVLYISIKSINPEVNAIFNPEEGTANQSSMSYQKFTTPAGAYLYGFEVNAAGELSLPILGKIQVVGMPQQKIEELVQQKADLYLKDAMVKVKLLNFKVTVLGEVRSPGVYYNYNNTFTVLEALAMANGNTDFATIKKIMVVRPGVDGNTSYMIDLSSKDMYLSEAFYLHPNDYVFVQPDKHKNLQLNSQAYSMLLSSISLMLAVLAFALR
ncbi:MAG: polysaccharide biosynthesis/export family protein [Bacteroidota bacterium]|nr:polysaccharide biosynthesis/export family protein [Bacteroidota bacterium]MDO9615276.1 polysaccharide biosynthesis/export family protein [Bacteroidota bacterium]